MSQIKVTFSGAVVAEPEKREVAGSNILEFPVYVNHTKKNKNTGDYEPTGEVSKIRVTLWREKAEMSDVRKGDIVEIVGTMVERNFTRKDGSEGRQLQTDYVESVVVKYRKDAPSSGMLDKEAWGSMVASAPKVEYVEEAPF
jgi:single-stranded DNA-binding protein